MTTATTYIYEAIAQYDNRAAGHVCYGRTAEECEERARRKTTMSVRVRRTTIAPETIAKLEAVGKL